MAFSPLGVVLHWLGLVQSRRHYVQFSLNVGLLVNMILVNLFSVEWHVCKSLPQSVNLTVEKCKFVG